VVRVDGKKAERASANAYYVMAKAASAAGVNIKVVSGFRTQAEQQRLYACYVNCNCNNCNLAARPGYSNHQSGHAFDLNTSAAGVLGWLNTNGARYGFKRTVPSEPWHWEWWSGGPGGGPCGATGEKKDAGSADARPADARPDAGAAPEARGPDTTPEAVPDAGPAGGSPPPEPIDDIVPPDLGPATEDEWARRSSPVLGDFGCAVAGASARPSGFVVCLLLTVALVGRRRTRR
jgi:hypothetical protein